MSQLNVSGWWRRSAEVSVGHCVPTHVCSIVSPLTRPEMVERFEDVEPKLVVRLELRLLYHAR